MKKVIEENYLSNTINSLKTSSAYMIGFGLYFMIFASHTSLLQNNEILSVIQMTQKEYSEFSLKNDGLVSLFLIWLGLFSIPKNLEIENNLVAKFLLATFVIVIINPRMKEYDLCIGVVSFFLLLRGTCPEYKKIMLIGLLCSISIWGNAFSKIIFPQFFLNGNVWQIIAIIMMMFFYFGLPNRKPRIR